MAAVISTNDKIADSRSRAAKIMISFSVLFFVLAIPLFFTVSAQQTVVDQPVQYEILDQAQLDQILAPIALYPDALLSQILVASTYPLEVVQAARWRQANAELSETQVLAAVEEKEWDPSVKALAPFTDLLIRISEDLAWLQSLGDAFLQSEEQVLASVQNLRQKAYENGSLANNEYHEIVEQDDNIVIESTQTEIIYVPYYDTRAVYGPWWWYSYQPVYWHRPSHYDYRRHGGIYFSYGHYVRPSIFYGGFHWGSRYTVVNHYYYDRHGPYRYANSHGNIHVSTYGRWSHDPLHRRGVRYPEAALKTISQHSSANNSTAKHAYSNTTRSGINSNRVSSSVARTTGKTSTQQMSAKMVQQKLHSTKPSGATSSATSNSASAGHRTLNTNIKTNNSAAINRSVKNAATTKPVATTARSNSAVVTTVKPTITNRTKQTTSNSTSVKQSSPVRPSSNVVRPRVVAPKSYNTGSTYNRASSSSSSSSTSYKTATPRISTQSKTSTSKPSLSSPKSFRR